MTTARWHGSRADLRARILDAAYAAIDHHGVRAVTLANLGEAVDADQAQVARVFSTMDEIYIGVIRHRDKSLASAFDVLEDIDRSRSLLSGLAITKPFTFAMRTRLLRLCGLTLGSAVGGH